VSARLGHAFVLAPDTVLALVDVRSGDRGERADRYLVAFVGRDGGLREAGEGDGAWRALAVAIAQGRTIGALSGGGLGNAPDAVLVCRPSASIADVAGLDHLAGSEEQPLGRDQTNTSVVLDETLLLKAYRRIQPGLNPDLELTAYLSEEARFSGVPPLAGYAEVITRDAGAATVAMLQGYVAHAADAYEQTADFLARLVVAPGSVSMDWATELADDLGTLVAGLHGALARPPDDVPDMAPRDATHDELAAWRTDVHRQLNRAIEVTALADPGIAADLRRWAAEIAARVSRFEALATAPRVMRIHADLHLGQVLVADDGYRLIDFEGEPLRPIEDRRRPDSPLRDVASLLRSFDHVARSARRRAERHTGGPIEQPGLDLDAWIERARSRFLSAYARGLRSSGAALTLDLDLLDAFEVAKEVREMVYAATVLPSWLWAPHGGMRWLIEHGEPAWEVGPAG
jgi:maltose alpha-D-glucosyltransferase/alpha-amylase